MINFEKRSYLHHPPKQRQLVASSPMLYRFSVEPIGWLVYPSGRAIWCKGTVFGPEGPSVSTFSKRQYGPSFLSITLSMSSFGADHWDAMRPLWAVSHSLGSERWPSWSSVERRKARQNPTVAEVLAQESKEIVHGVYNVKLELEWLATPTKAWIYRESVASLSVSVESNGNWFPKSAWEQLQGCSCQTFWIAWSSFIQRLVAVYSNSLWKSMSMCHGNVTRPRMICHCPHLETAGQFWGSTGINETTHFQLSRSHAEVQLSVCEWDGRGTVRKLPSIRSISHHQMEQWLKMTVLLVVKLSGIDHLDDHYNPSLQPQFVASSELRGEILVKSADRPRGTLFRRCPKLLE